MTQRDSNLSRLRIQDALAIDGGKLVRTKPLPLEFPGVHHMNEEEEQAVLRVIRSRSLFRFYGIDLQAEVEAFESEIRQFLGISHALAVTSGTGALHVALSALGVGPDQEVIVPAYLWVSVVAAVVNLGAIRVLAEIDETFCLDPSDVRRRSQDIRNYRGDMGVFSFQMNKNMSSGEGGCIVTNNQRLYDRSVTCHDTGYARDENGRVILDDLDLCLWGRGYRLDELGAAILRVQLKKLPLIIANMRRSKYRILRELERYPQIRLLSIIDPAGDTGAFLIVTDSEFGARVSESPLGPILIDVRTGTVTPIDWRDKDARTIEVGVTDSVVAIADASDLNWPQAPDAPSGLSAKRSGRQVQLEWEADVGARGFELERSVGWGSWQKIAELKGAERHYS